MKVLFCGYGRAGKEILLQLLLNGNICYSDIFVFTHDLKENIDFLDFLKGFRIRHTVANINDSFQLIKDFSPKYLVSAYYRLIVKEEILELVDYKAMNLHPSILPDYKGCFSTVWAILNGEKETGISFHFMTNTVDSGNIILQKRIAIQDNDTAYSLYHKLISLFVFNINEAFDLFASGYPENEQNSGQQQRYYSRKLPFNGVLNSNDTNIDFAHRFVRAMYFPPYPSAKFLIDGKEIEISKVEKLYEYKDYFKKQK